MATSSTLARDLARDLAEEYAQLGKLVEKANRIAAETRQLEENATEIRDIQELTSQSDAQDNLRDLVDQTAEEYIAMRKKVEVNDIRRRTDFMALRWQIRTKPPHEYSFPQFGRLPPELRVMIWKEAMPENHKIWVAGHQHFIMPTIGHVCRESRDVVVKEFKGCGCYDDEDVDYIRTKVLDYPNWWPIECQNHPSTFDPQTGILILQEQKQDVILIPRLLKQAREIVLDFSAQANGSWEDIIGSSGWYGLFPYLETPPVLLHNQTVSVMSLPPTLIDRRSAPPALIEALFGNNAYFILDLVDSAEVQRIAGLMEQLREFWPGDTVSLEKVVEPGVSYIERLARNELGMDWWTHAWGGLRSELQNMFVLQMVSAVPDGTEDFYPVAARLFKQANIEMRAIHIFGLVDPDLPDSSTWWMQHYDGRLYRGCEEDRA